MVEGTTRPDWTNRRVAIFGAVAAALVAAGAVYLGIYASPSMKSDAPTPATTQKLGNLGSGGTGPSTFAVSTGAEFTGAVGNWASALTVGPNAQVSVLIRVRNTGRRLEKNWTARVFVADNRIVPTAGSTTIFTSNFPDGTPDAATALWTTGSIIGNYYPAAGAYVRFHLAVGAATAFPCGNTLVPINVQVWIGTGFPAVSSLPLTVSNTCKD